MSTSTDDWTAERVGRNQALFRRINETVEDLNDALDETTAAQTWVCECADEACTTTVTLTLGQYRAVRAHPLRFVVAPSDEHVLPAFERVVQRNLNYWVVEKVGRAAETTLDSER